MLMDDGVRLRTVPPKNLNGDARQHRCSDSVEIRVDATCPPALFKIVDSTKSDPTGVCQITEIEQSHHFYKMHI